MSNNTFMFPVAMKEKSLYVRGPLKPNKCSYEKYLRWPQQNRFNYWDNCLFVFFFSGIAVLLLFNKYMKKKHMDAFTCPSSRVNMKRLLLVLLVMCHL